MLLLCCRKLSLFWADLIFFSPPFHKKRSGRERDGKRGQAKHLLFFGGATILFDHIRTTSGKAHTRLGMFCRWSHNRLKPKKARLASCFQKQGQDSCFDLILSKPAAKAGCSVINHQQLCDTISSSLLWVRLDTPSFGTITKPWTNPSPQKNPLLYLWSWYLLSESPPWNLL